MRLIDVESLRDYLLRRQSDEFFYDRQFTAEDIVLMLDREPTAYPTKVSRWLRTDDSSTRFVCEKCRKHSITERFTYCPHCGARMNVPTRREEVTDDGDQRCDGDTVEDQHGEGAAHRVKRWLLSR